MYKILLADNEGVILDSLIHMIYERFGEACDIRTAKTAQSTRTLARKFIPDIAVINIQMPGMRGFDVVREIRSYHIKCVFITVSSYGKNAYQSEARGLNTLAHLTKPLYREKILPVLERAVSIVSHSRKRAEQTQQIQANFDAVVPILEQGLIGQLFFPADAAENIARYKELLDIPQNYFKAVTFTFGEADALQSRRTTDAAQSRAEADAAQNRKTTDAAQNRAEADALQSRKTADAAQNRAEADAAQNHAETDALQNAVGSAVHLHREYGKFREIVHEYFPLAVIGPVMGNHVMFLQPYWREEETAREKKEFTQSLAQLLEALENGIPRLTFRPHVSGNFRYDAVPSSDIL